jgi:hypothetical protein
VAVEGEPGVVHGEVGEGPAALGRLAPFGDVEAEHLAEDEV